MSDQIDKASDQLPGPAPRRKFGVRRLVGVLAGWWCRGNGLSPREVVLRDQLAHGTSPVWPTRTKVDVGHWHGNARVCATVAGPELVLFAVGKRPFVERLPVTALAASAYNHVTGEVVLAPAPEARVSRLALPPVEGRELLQVIQGKGH